MRLKSIAANRHLFDGQVNGKPLQLLLGFDSGCSLRLQVASDGERMIANNGRLDAPSDLDEYGQMDIADVTQSLFPTLCDLEVADVRTLALNGRMVGVKLIAASAEPFHFWVDGDELHWGDEAALANHDWLDGLAPSASERIEV